MSVGAAGLRGPFLRCGRADCVAPGEAAHGVVAIEQSVAALRLADRESDDDPGGGLDAHARLPDPMEVPEDASTAAAGGKTEDTA